MSTEQSTPKETQIPLEFAAIGWSRATDKSFPASYSRVVILDIRTHRIPSYFQFTHGAVFAWWKNSKTPTYKRLLELLWLRGEMIADRVPIEDIHEAMDKIPEFIEWIESSNADAESVTH